MKNCEWQLEMWDLAMKGYVYALFFSFFEMDFWYVAQASSQLINLFCILNSWNQSWATQHHSVIFKSSEWFFLIQNLDFFWSGQMGQREAEKSNGARGLLLSQSVSVKLSLICGPGKHTDHREPNRLSAGKMAECSHTLSELCLGSVRNKNFT